MPCSGYSLHYAFTPWAHREKILYGIAVSVGNRWYKVKVGKDQHRKEYVQSWFRSNAIEGLSLGSLGFLPLSHACLLAGRAEPSRAP